MLFENTKLTAGPAFSESWNMRYQIVDVHADRALVGSPNDGIGAVYVFRRVGSSWVQEQKINNPGASGALFGASVSLNDDVAVIGAPYATAFAGAVYVYRRSGTTWTLEDTLTAAGASNFGTSVSLDDPVLLIGAGIAGIPGRAYIFRYDGSSWEEEQMLTPAGPGTREAYGQSVGLDGPVALVGCPLHNNARGVDAGSMYVFRFDGAIWAQEQEIIASDGAAQDYFGWKVSLKGNVAAAGAQNVDGGPTLGIGAAYVFEFNGTSWVEFPRIEEQIPNPGGHFGMTVATNGTSLLVSAPNAYTSLNGGPLGLFRLYRKVGSSWYLDRTLGITTRGEIGNFAAIDSERVILGTNLGFDPFRAFIYDLVATDCNGNSILDAADIADGPSMDCQPNCIPDECELSDESQTDCNSNFTLDVCDIAAGASFDCNFNFLPDECDVTNGSEDCDNDSRLEDCPEQLGPPFDGFAQTFGSIGNAQVRGDVAIVGDSRGDHPSLAATGKAIVYRYDGARWSVEQSLFASDGETDDAFGASVSIFGDVAIVGAPDEDHGALSGNGAAYVFRRVANTWVEEAKLTAGDGEANDHFGNAVGIDGDLALVAAYQGAFAPGSSNIGCVYAFRKSGGIWVEEQKLGDVTTPGSQDRFGISLSMRGDLAAIGADKDITPALFVQGGVAHVYRHNGTSWVSQAKVWAPDAVAGLEFGSSISVSGSWLAVGAESYFANGAFKLGAAYLYRFNGSAWNYHGKLLAPDGSDGDSFAHSVAVDGDFLVVGSDRDDNQAGENAGSAYLFEWNGSSWLPSSLLLAQDAELFGSSVSVDANNILVTSASQFLDPPPHSGLAYFYGVLPHDCNENADPDRCELSSGQSADCQENGFLDECDIELGSSMDSNGDLIPDECNTTIPLADGSMFDKTRCISFTLPPAGVTVGTALRVNLASLHHVNPPYTGGAGVPFTSFEGQVRWVGPPSQYVESSSSGTPFFASSLQCSPHYQDWSTIGLLHVTGSAIVPSSIYEVENVSASCTGNEANCETVSEPLTIVTTRWGDVETPYNPPSLTVQPDVADISSLVNKFRSAPGSPIKARALLAGEAGNPFGEITTEVLNVDLGFSHISACVDAFRGRPYPYTIQPCP